MDFLIKYIFFFFILLFISCSKNDPAKVEENSVGKDMWDSHVPFKTNYGTFNMPMTNKYEPLPFEQGRVEMSEASGIAFSTVNPGMIWAHNDSGNGETLVLLDAETGEIVAKYFISGARNTDWEDIEVSVGPETGTTYIYISDTGDNERKRANVSVYRFEEIKYLPAHKGKTITIDNIKIDRLRFEYPNGSQDVEAMFVDPFTKDIYFATKRSEVSILYIAPYPQKIDDVYSVYKAGEFSFRDASAGTCSLDGKRVLIKNRQEIFYWERQDNETMISMLSRTPVKAPYVGEEQGEAVCFGDSYSYYTLSEKANNTAYPMLYKYELKK